MNRTGHSPDGEHYGGYRVYYLRNHHAEHHADCVYVVDGIRHEVSGAVSAVKIHRKINKMRIEPVSYVNLHLSGGNDDKPAPAKARNKHHNGN